MCLSLQCGQSPLMVAASRGNVKCVQLLVDKGADVNHQDKVSSFHHEMRSLPLVHVYHISFSYMNGIQYSISFKSTMSEKKRSFSPYLFDYDHFQTSFSHVWVPFYFHAY